MESKVTVLMDVDGVVADFTTPYLEIAYDLFQLRFKPEDVTDWHYGQALGIPPEDEERIYKVMKQPGFAFDRIKPYPGAVNCVDEMSKFADIVFVTAPLPSRTSCTWTNDRDRWLQYHFGASKDNIIHTSAKQYIDGDVLVDDKPANLYAWEARNHPYPWHYAILWDQPYNQEERRHTRISSWGDLIEEVKDLC